jgi:hypothetical protein
MYTSSAYQQFSTAPVWVMERETPEEERRSMMELITGTELAG